MQSVLSKRACIIPLAMLLTSLSCRNLSMKEEEHGIFVAVAKEQEKAALDAISKLRELFNMGNCPAIYNQAFPSFRARPINFWLDQCEQFREQLGSWRSFSPTSALTCGVMDTVCVVGTSLFDKDHFAMTIAWHLKGKLPHLLSLYSTREGKTWSLMPPYQDHLRDPPPITGGSRPDRKDLQQNHASLRGSLSSHDKPPFELPLPPAKGQIARRTRQGSQ